jgi:hypothetical protein
MKIKMETVNGRLCTHAGAATELEENHLGAHGRWNQPELLEKINHTRTCCFLRKSGTGLEPQPLGGKRDPDAHWPVAARNRMNTLGGGAKP